MLRRKVMLAALVVFLCSLALTLNAIRWRPTSADCRLTLAPAKDEGRYHYTEPVDLILTLKNESKEVVTLEETDLFAMCRIEVRLHDGTPAPLTLEGQRQTESAGASSEFGYPELASGQSDVLTIGSLNRLFDMTLLGEYTVTVSRRIIPKQLLTEAVELHSNPIKISVHDSIRSAEEK